MLRTWQPPLSLIGDGYKCGGDSGNGSDMGHDQKGWTLSGGDEGGATTLETQSPALASALVTLTSCQCLPLGPVVVFAAFWA